MVEFLVYSVNGDGDGYDNPTYDSDVRIQGTKSSTLITYYIFAKTYHHRTQTIESSSTKWSDV